MQQEYQVILVAVDGSKASKNALQKGIEMANKSHAKLVITHVIDTSVYSSNISVSLNYSKMEEHAKQFLEECKEIAVQADVSDVVVHLDYGYPKLKIPKQIAKAFKADLVICGATGHNAVERFFIGSVSENIIRYAKVDVLVVREDSI